MQEEKREQAVRANDSGDEMEIDLAVLFRDFFKIFSKLWWLVLILIAAGIAAYGAFLLCATRRCIGVRPHLQ